VSFGHPLLLLTLLVLPLAVLVYLWLERRPAKYTMTFTNVDVLASVAGGRSLRRYVPPALALLALAALCIAVARPHRTTLVASDRATVVLVIDVSGSMRATDVKPSRLAAAQNAVRSFLKKVPHNVRVALIAFAGDPQVAAPPTTDLDVVRQGLDSLGYYSGYGGTAIGDAIAAAVELVKPRNQNGTQTIAYTTIADAKKSPVSILFPPTGTRRADCSSRSRAPTGPRRRGSPSTRSRWARPTASSTGDPAASAGASGPGRASDRPRSRCRPTPTRCGRSPRPPAASSSTPAPHRRSSPPTRTSARWSRG
jgi:hypothetical protein